MIDREKIVKGLELCIMITRTNQCLKCPYGKEERNSVKWCTHGLHLDVLALLKEQEESEKRIYKKICDIIRNGCSTDTDDDKDFVCNEIQKCFMEGSETE